MKTETDSELSAFIDDWNETPAINKATFLRLKDYLAAKEGAAFEFISRPGVTYSLRFVHPAQKERGLFVMVDVIEDDPRWLSVCFYGEMITDPEEKGDFVPEGLLGEDAVCFDIEERDEELIGYVESRLDEAYRSASGQ